jgi:hypothetical protein
MIQLYVGIAIHFILEVNMHVSHYRKSEDLFIDEGIAHLFDG